jgi:hypothetical protein
LKKVQTPQQDFLNAVFRAFNHREDENKWEKEKQLMVSLSFKSPGP